MNINVNSHGQEKNIISRREEGVAYLDRRNISMPVRPMGPPCHSQFCTLVDRIPITQKSAQSNSRRTCRPTYNYNLQCSRVKYQVCAKIFADTFGVSSRTIGDWISTSILVITHAPTTNITPEAVLSDTTTITP